jgi:hypothetical protein
MHVLTSDAVRVVSDDEIAAYRRDGSVHGTGGNETPHPSTSS